MGDRAGKYWLRGCSKRGDKSGYPHTKKPSKPGPEYLAEELETRLVSYGEVCMEVLVQLQRHPILNPIEDPSVLWKDIPAEIPESELKRLYADIGLKAPPPNRIRSAEFYPVARISFPADDNKDFRSRESKEFCEGQLFNVWHTLDEHRPLGNVNRVRLQAYLASWLNRQTKPQ